MRASWVILLFFVLTGCEPKVDKEKLPHLNGYWEIEKVAFPDGSSKSYSVNALVDFIQIEGTEGYRKKVQPQLDGTFRTSDDAEKFSVLEISGRLILQYVNAELSWEETLVALSENRFEVVNASGISYQYKRYQPLKIDP